eukprot:m.4969 g.4969  ORF g.4969 m.4969 type:complete len:284 (+) comp1958_c0_seq1:3-854(+)
MLSLLDEVLEALGACYSLFVDVLVGFLSPVLSVLADCLRPHHTDHAIAVRILPQAALAPGTHALTHTPSIAGQRASFTREVAVQSTGTITQRTSLYLEPSLVSYGKKKVLVLDLDETLVHSMHSRIITRYDYTLKVTLDAMTVQFYVRYRPYVRLFLDTVARWYEVVVFTASLPQYGCPVIDALDPARRISRRFYRDSCTAIGQPVPVFAKDLTLVCPDLASVAIVDNSPSAYLLHPENAIPVRTWTCDAKDTELLALLPFLDALRLTSDVRSVLGLRTPRIN